MKREYIKFNTITQVYTDSRVVEIEELCNSIRVTNLGADSVMVDGQILHPGTVGSILGDGYTIGGNPLEIYDKRVLVIAFVTVVNPAVEIVQKYFT